MQFDQIKHQVTVLVLLGLVLATSVAQAAWSTSPYVNNPVDIQPQDAEWADSVPDGSGGMLVFYVQSPDGVVPADVLAQRIDSDGNLVWGAPVMVWDNVNPDYPPLGFQLLSDEAGGAFIALSIIDGTNARVNVQHINSNGALSWAAAGVPVLTALTGFNMINPALALDGAGGIYVAWEDYFAEATTGVDIYAQRVDAAGNLLWDPSGTHVCSAPEYQNYIHMVRDGAGGCFVVWSDGRNAGFPEIFGQRLMPDSSPAWSFNGRKLETDFDSTQNPRVVEGGPAGGFLVSFSTFVDPVSQIALARYDDDGSPVWEMFPTPEPSLNQFTSATVADGQGGAFVSVSDDRNPGVSGIQLYLQAVSPSGVKKWAPAGVAAGLMDGAQGNSQLVPDGTGGVVAIWKDGRTADLFAGDLYGQRISNNGTRMWGESGTAIAAGVGSDAGHSVHPDGQGGVLVAFKSERNNNQFDIFAQRVGYHGKLGNANPKITAITDYPQDQGGVVLLDWDPSYLDDLSHLEIDHYTIWSRYAGVGQKSVLDGPELETKIRQLVGETDLDPEMLRSQLKSGWTMVDQVDAFQRDAYTSFASTHADSSAAGMPVTEFQVLAHGQASVYWESNILGGHSVDNLAPGAPLFLAASYLNPDGVLEWSPSTIAAPDLAGYRIYRSGVAGFTPGPASFVAATPDTSFADVNLTGGTWYYLVTAEDFTNNESAPSNQVSLQTAVSAVDSETPRAFAVLGVMPNPFNPSTSIHFSLEQGGPTSVEVFDTRGRLVRRLVNETMGAGRHEAVWDGRDDQGRGLPSGVYLAQIRSGAERVVTKMTLAK